jgi:hypothetical protein
MSGRRWRAASSTRCLALLDDQWQAPGPVSLGSFANHLPLPRTARPANFLSQLFLAGTHPAHHRSLTVGAAETHFRRNTAVRACLVDVLSWRSAPGPIKLTTKPSASASHHLQIKRRQRPRLTSPDLSQMLLVRQLKREGGPHRPPAPLATPWIPRSPASS